MLTGFAIVPPQLTSFVLVVLIVSINTSKPTYKTGTLKGKLLKFNIINRGKLLHYILGCSFTDTSRGELFFIVYLYINGASCSYYMHRVMYIQMKRKFQWKIQTFFVLHWTEYIAWLSLYTPRMSVYCTYMYNNFKKWELRVQVLYIKSWKNLSFFPWKFIFSQLFSRLLLYIHRVLITQRISMNSLLYVRIHKIVFVYCFAGEKKEKNSRQSKKADWCVSFSSFCCSCGGVSKEKRKALAFILLNRNSWAHNIASLVCACIRKNWDTENKIFYFWLCWGWWWRLYKVS